MYFAYDLLKKNSLTQSYQKLLICSFFIPLYLQYTSLPSISIIIDGKWENIYVTEYVPMATEGYLKVVKKVRVN